MMVTQNYDGVPDGLMQRPGGGLGMMAQSVKHYADKYEGWSLTPGTQIKKNKLGRGGTLLQPWCWMGRNWQLLEAQWSPV